MKLLTAQQNVELVAMPALEPPEFQIDAAMAAKAEEDLRQAQNIALPDDEDDI